MLRSTVPILSVLLLTACGPQTGDPPQPTPSAAQSAVDRAIAWQGGAILDNAEFSFTFRDYQFRVTRSNGLFSYERRFVDSTGASVRDVLSNSGLTREVNMLPVELDSAAYASAETAVNSVVYFALLPLPLNDPAARKRLLSTPDIEGRTYSEVEVTFRPEGGGRDFDDRFVYWLDQDDGSLDYLAYYFHVDDTGTRFRKAVNIREINGVRVADYLNYRHDLPGLESIESYDSLYQAGELELVSEIRLEDVSIRRLPHAGDS